MPMGTCVVSFSKVFYVNSNGYNVFRTGIEGNELNFRVGKPEYWLRLKRIPEEMLPLRYSGTTGLCIHIVLSVDISSMY